MVSTEAAKVLVWSEVVRGRGERFELGLTLSQGNGSETFPVRGRLVKQYREGVLRS